MVKLQQDKYGVKAQIGYIDTDRFIIHIKTEDFPNYVKDDEEKRFNTSNHKAERPLQIIIVIIIIIIIIIIMKIENWLV